VPINEALGAFGKRLVRVIGPIDDLDGDVLGHVPRQALGGVEGHHAQRVVVFAGDKVPDDGLEVASSSAVST
jgi:hypothetical protein